MPIGLGSEGTGSPRSARAQFPAIEADPSDLDVDGGGATEPLNGLRSDADDLQLLQPSRDGRNTVEVIDDPVGVEEVARPHSRAGGRVVTRRSA